MKPIIICAALVAAIGSATAQPSMYVPGAPPADPYIEPKRDGWFISPPPFKPAPEDEVAWDYTAPAPYWRMKREWWMPGSGDPRERD